MHGSILFSAVDSLVGRSKRRGNKKLLCLPAPGRLVVDRSTTWRVAPARTNVLTVFDNAWDRGIAAGIGEHLGSAGAVVLRVVVGEWNALGVIVIARLLTIRTPRFCVNY